MVTRVQADFSEATEEQGNLGAYTKGGKMVREAVAQVAQLAVGKIGIPRANGRGLGILGRRGAR